VSDEALRTDGITADAGATEAGEAAATAHIGHHVSRRNALFPIGVDYHPLDDERGSASDWYAGNVDLDFAAMAKARLSLVRVFISWRYFEPQVGQYDEDAFERLDDIVASARTHNLQLIVCFFADDRLAELTSVPWGARRDPRTDAYLLQREVALVQRIVNHYRTEPTIFAWDLANEAFLTGFASSGEMLDWVSALREAIREVEPERPVTFGGDPETLLRATGVDPSRALDECEFVISHRTSPYEAYVAPGPIDSGPSSYLDSFLLRSARRDLPVLVDSIGPSSLEFSLAQEAAAVRGALYSTVMNRGAGALVRRWRDLDTEKREPYFRDPYETLVGLIDTEGESKPAMGEVSAFARMLARLDLRRFALVPERAAVVVPAERYEPLPEIAGLFAPRSCLQAYMLAKEAHLPVDVVREGDDLSELSLLIVPSVSSLSSPMWQVLADAVYRGASVVMSYGGGDPAPAVRDVFGVEFLGDAGARARLSCRVAQHTVLGPIESFDVPLEVPAFALLGQGSAIVVATDAAGSPLLTVNMHGQGRAVFVATPLERSLAQAYVWDPASPPRALLRTVYGAVGAAAGAAPPVVCDRPEVEVALMTGEGEDVVLLLSHAPRKLTALITAERAVATVSDLRGGAPVELGGREFGVPLGPNGAAALRLTYA
jgi:endo-1,4-beta-mannosidase